MLSHHSAEAANPERVVVLGATGFIGRAVTHALEDAGVAVLGLGSADIDLAAHGAGNRLAARLRPNDALVLLSALTPDKGRGVATFMTNMRMAAAVAEAAAISKLSQLVHFSSDSVYPMNVDLISEHSCTQPRELYGMMHLAREVMMQSSIQAAVAVLRPTLVFGAADTHGSYGPNRLRRMAHKDSRMVLFGEGEEMRDHILVDDVAALTVLTIRHRSSGILNLATGRSVSYAELARKIAALFDRPVEIATAARQNPITHRHFDVTAVHKAFPTFRFTSLEEGLARAHREMLAAELGPNRTTTAREGPRA